MTNILVLVGSLRAASLNRQLAEVAVELGTAEGLDVTVYGGLGELPFYNEDLDTADAPAGVWAHDETRKSFGIAGGRVVDSITLSVPAGTLDGRHPREAAELVAGVREALQKLAEARAARSAEESVA